MTIGQEFAIRWLNKNHPVKSPRGQQHEVDPVAFCQEIAAAVDAYTEKKRTELERVLRRVVCAALDDGGARNEVRVSAKELLESECMTYIARRVTGGLARPPRFPVNLHS